MNRKKEINLKNLKWHDILLQSSDDEYDSDETCCDMNISTVEEDKEGLDYTRKNGTENINHIINIEKPFSLIPPEKIISNNCATLDVKIEQNKQQLTEANDSTVKELLTNEIPVPQENLNHTESPDHSSAIQSTQHERMPYATCKTDKSVKCYRKYPKVIVTKALPKRRCNSTFINNSLRSDSEEGYATFSETEDSKIIESTKIIVKNTVPTSSGNGTSKGDKTGITKKRSKRRGRKRKDLTDTSSTDLGGIDVELKIIEDRVESWMSGKNIEPPSRHQAFQMLAQSQNIIKLLDMHRPKYNTQYCAKNKKLTIKLLLKRAKIVSVVIDKAIAEADRLMNLEEATNIDSEPDQDVQIIEDNLKTTNLKPILKKTSRDDSEESSEYMEMTNLKPILKKTSRDYSEESNEYNDKHVSFSDDVEYCYISSMENGSKLYTQVQSSSKNEENLDNTQLKDTSTGIDSEENLTDNWMISVERNSNQIKEITTNSEHCYISGMENGSKLYTEVQSSSKNEENLDNNQLKDTSSEIDSVEHLIANCIISVERNSNQIKEITTNSESSLGTNQEILTDNEVGVQSETSTGDDSNIENKSDEYAWYNHTIGTIKYIRIRQDDEWVPASEAAFTDEDFIW